MNKEELFMKRFGDETVFCLEYDKETLKDLVIKLQQENKQLKERIDKAIEYIEYCLEENCEESCDYLDNQWIGKKLLEILKGDD